LTIELSNDDEELEEDEEDDEDVVVTSIGQTRKSAYAVYSEHLIAALDINVDHLVRAALNLCGMPCGTWIQRRKSGKNRYENFVGDLVLMLLGMDRLVLEHSVKGDLPRQAHVEKTLENKLRILRRSGDSSTRPTIYAQYLVDDEGLSPNPDDLRRALDIMERYTKSEGGHDLAADKEAATIDTQLGRLSRSATNSR
jgi:hypothetical protein